MNNDLSIIPHGAIGCVGTTGPIGTQGLRGIEPDTWNYVLNKKSQFLTEEELVKCRDDIRIYDAIIKKYNLESFSDKEIISILREETIKILNK